MANKYTKQAFDLERAISLYESGLSQGEVGEVLGTTQKVVHQRFKAAGYACRIAAKRNQFGEANHMWKGAFTNDSGSRSDVTYAARLIRPGPTIGRTSRVTMPTRTTTSECAVLAIGSTTTKNRTGKVL